MSDDFASWCEKKSDKFIKFLFVFLDKQLKDKNCEIKLFKKAGKTLQTEGQLYPAEKAIALTFSPSADVR